MDSKNNQDIVSAIDALTRATLGKVDKSVDANGWTVKKSPSGTVYEKTFTCNAVGVPANNNTSLGTLTMPVGISNGMTGLKIYFGVEGGFAGRIYASIDNGNTLVRTGAVSLQIGNLTTGLITFTGYVHVMITTD